MEDGRATGWKASAWKKAKYLYFKRYMFSSCLGHSIFFLDVSVTERLPEASGSSKIFAKLGSTDRFVEL